MRRFVTLAILALGLVAAVPSALASDSVQFNYQARVLVGEVPTSCDALVKLAITNSSGTLTLWSNDMTSVNGSEPAGAISAPVVNGMLDIMVGDTELGMEPVHGIVFNGRENLKLKVWFSDGVHGFEQLTPDRRIPNPRVLRLAEITEPLTLYVNGATGNDENTGLTTDTAKKTIQAAADALPKHISSNVNVEIADGTYTDPVRVWGVKVRDDCHLTFTGDTETVDLETNDLKVILDGGSQPVTMFKVQECSINVELIGIQASHAQFGFDMVQTGAILRSCKSTHHSFGGFRSISNTYTVYYDCVAKNNVYNGFDFAREICAVMIRCISKYNQQGINGQSHSMIDLRESGDFSNNGWSGIFVTQNCMVQFQGGYSGKLNNNARYGISLFFNSGASFVGLNQITGNGYGTVEMAYDSVQN